jgi:thioredoxin 1
MNTLLKFLALTVFFCASQVLADTQSFSSASFSQLQQAGKPVLVSIHASWCPTCQAQAKVIGQLLSKPEYKDIASLRVDYDKQPDIVKSFKASQQSVLIAFKAGKEVARSTGETDAAAIEAMLQKLL